jgi:hypothetical protein
VPDPDLGVLEVEGESEELDDWAIGEAKVGEVEVDINEVLESTL